jgi:hypothetical protein
MRMAASLTVTAIRSSNGDLEDMVHLSFMILATNISHPDVQTEATTRMGSLGLFRGKRIHNRRPPRIDPFQYEGGGFDLSRLGLSLSYSSAGPSTVPMLILASKKSADPAGPMKLDGAAERQQNRPMRRPPTLVSKQ